MRPRPWRQWTVRARMVVWITALGTVALIVTNTAGVVLLRTYLTNRIDGQLHAQVRGIAARLPPPPERQDTKGTPTFGPSSRMYRFDATGNRVDAEPEPLPLGTPAQIVLHGTDGRPYTVDTADGSWRVKVAAEKNGDGYVALAVSLSEVTSTGDELLLANAAVAALVLLLMGVAAASVVRVGLRPLTRMERTAAEIAGGDLSRRVTDADPHTEAGRLGTALNMMLGRIEEAVDEQAASEQRLRRFLADAAHELRTPLTTLQGFAELYLRGGMRSRQDVDEAMYRIESEAARMRLLVTDLMTLARLDEERPLHRRPVDLLEIAADAVRDASIRMPTRVVGLSALDERSDTFEALTVLADADRVRQVVTNLVANALQHTPEHARVAVRVGRPPGSGEPPLVSVGELLAPGTPTAAVEVADTGPGMAHRDAVRAFERLFRADPSRSRRHGGAGLGLSIVASIVRKHGGRVELWTAPGRGARFRVLLPISSPTKESPC
ncbi:two-component sensor histidine kinase [Virgisporangium aliadipatigenens]|uniref:histidine kinase n=1 Tax=Virgisporangium aliadipatigenens TaxID=741659 RepID=A0A8J3YP04_9ACTN|nr:HAMP domain-containing sensor histidine kinase [Virgisporangium aliadipatigenens]GIJ49099.1 two-component sensor histidine kinase [Virgisporangium aliadipatigenens]